METKNIRERLLQSLKHYEQLFDCMKTLENEIGTASPTALLQFNDVLKQLLEKMTKDEEDLNLYYMSNSERQEDIQRLFQTREHLMKDILLFNQKITQKASGIKSFVGYEMSKLNTGLSAMQGYRQSARKQGRIIDNSY